EANLDKAQREEAAADRIYGLLPADQRDEYRALREEFEEGRTAEAKFAACLDRLQPLIHNYKTNGGTWMMHQVTSEQVKKRMERVKEASSILGKYVQWIIEDSIAQGTLKE